MVHMYSHVIGQIQTTIISNTKFIDFFLIEEFVNIKTKKVHTIVLH